MQLVHHLWSVQMFNEYIQRQRYTLRGIIYNKIKSEYNRLKVSPLNTNTRYKHPTSTEGAMPIKFQYDCHSLK